MKSKKQASDWKKELARDFLAIGSWLFFILVAVRILILPYRWPYLNHLLIAGGLILLIDIFVRGRVNSYVSRGIVIGFYLSIFYENTMFSIFVKLALAGLVASGYYLSRDWKKILYGVVLGLVGIGIKFIL